jgi:hypothetical protein
VGQALPPANADNPLVFIGVHRRLSAAGFFLALAILAAAPAAAVFLAPA